MAKLFNSPKKFKNRRFTPWEMQEERIVAAAFRRPVRHFFHDKPTYPYFPPEPLVNQPLVNFDLGFTK